MEQGPYAGLANEGTFGAFVKFSIEILRSAVTGAEVLHRASVEGLNLKGAQLRAENMLAMWRKRGATGFKIFNHRGEELYFGDA